MASTGDINVLRKNKDTLVKLIQAGVTHLSISKFFNVSIHSIRDFCSLNSIKSPMYLDGNPMKEKMVKMLSRGEAVASIHKVTHISYRTIRQTADKYGYKYILSYVPISKRTVSRILVLLRCNYSSQQIIDKLKLTNISCKTILDLKKKNHIVGLTRGGVSNIPPEEIKYIKQLIKQKIPTVEIVELMSKKFNKVYGYELIRGRCRSYGYQSKVARVYDDNEKKLMMKCVREGLTLIDTVALFPSRSYQSLKKLREMVKAYDKRDKLKEAV